MLEHNILFTADIHGNERQLEAFLEYALIIEPQTIVLGGDLAPKRNLRKAGDKYISQQREFLSTSLPDYVREFKSKLPDTRIFLLMGNDDAAANLDVLQDHPALYTEIHGRRARLNHDFDIVGYSCVPITPFGVKDWEKFDLTAVPKNLEKEYQQRKRTDYSLVRGLKSTKDLKWQAAEFTATDESKDSIQLDLQSGVYTTDPDKTVYLFHAPPNNLALDKTWDDHHAGSFAIREFIEQHQPYLTMHGHIHEAVDLSNGVFRERLGRTTSVSAGNDNEDSYLSVLVLDLYDLNKINRVRLPCTMWTEAVEGLKEYLGLKQ